MWIGNIMTIWGIELVAALLPPPLIWGPSSGRGLTLPFDNRAIPATSSKTSDHLWLVLPGLAGQSCYVNRYAVFSSQWMSELLTRDPQSISISIGDDSVFMFAMINTYLSNVIGIHKNFFILGSDIQLKIEKTTTYIFKSSYVSQVIEWVLDKIEYNTNFLSY